MELCREVLAGVTAAPYTADFVVSEAESNTMSDTRHKIRQIERLGRPKEAPAGAIAEAIQALLRRGKRRGSIIGQADKRPNLPERTVDCLSFRVGSFGNISFVGRSASRPTADTS